MSVRYRYDNARQKRFKPVKLIGDEQDWIPGVIIPVDKRVFARIRLRRNRVAGED
jgi:hypothetical protein